MRATTQVVRPRHWRIPVWCSSRCSLALAGVGVAVLFVALSGDDENIVTTGELTRTITVTTPSPAAAPPPTPTTATTAPTHTGATPAPPADHPHDSRRHNPDHLHHVPRPARGHHAHPDAEDRRLTPERGR